MRCLTTLIVTLLLFSSLTASAAPRRKCPPKCKHRQATCEKAPTAATPVVVAAAPAPAPTIWDQLVDGFEINAGFRWEPEHECATVLVPVPPTHVRDPFYVGAGFRLPLAPRADLCLNFDRDFTDAPRWQTRLFLSGHPFRR